MRHFKNPSRLSTNGLLRVNPINEPSTDYDFGLRADALASLDSTRAGREMPPLPYNLQTPEFDGHEEGLSE